MTKVIATFRDCTISKDGCNLDTLLAISDEMKAIDDRIIIFLPHAETNDEWQARIKKVISDRTMELGFITDSIFMPTFLQVI